MRGEARPFPDPLGTFPLFLVKCPGWWKLKRSVPCPGLGMRSAGRSPRSRVDSSVTSAGSGLGEIASRTLEVRNETQACFKHDPDARVGWGSFQLVPEWIAKTFPKLDGVSQKGKVIPSQLSSAPGPRLASLEPSGPCLSWQKWAWRKDLMGGRTVL